KPFVAKPPRGRRVNEQAKSSRIKGLRRKRGVLDRLSRFWVRRSERTSGAVERAGCEREPQSGRELVERSAWTALLRRRRSRERTREAEGRAHERRIRAEDAEAKRNIRNNRY